MNEYMQSAKSITNYTYMYAMDREEYMQSARIMIVIQILSIGFSELMMEGIQETTYKGAQYEQESSE